MAQGESAQVKIKFLGGTKEVGRSAVAVISENANLLLDYGVQLNHEPGFPLHFSPKNLDGIVITHAHLDHSGAAPIFYVRNRVPLYANSLTLELIQILTNDLIKLAGYYLPYEYQDLDKMMECRVNVNYGEEVDIGDMKVMLMDAGHIPGSAQIKVAVNNKTLVYTGDINARQTKLLNGAKSEYGDIFGLIIEATYANEDHQPRLELESAFVNRVKEVVENGGTVLVPAFSVGRSQEVLCILEAHGFNGPITMDGMALQVNEVMLRYPSAFSDYTLLRRALGRAKWVHHWKARREAVNKPGVIVSPAGMLKGGAAAFYVEKVAQKKKNAIFLVSYQIPGTPGRLLLEKHKILVNGRAMHVEADAERFDFSSHSGRSELETLLKSVHGNPTIYTVHGNSKNCQDLADWVKSEQGFEAVTPSAGEVYKL